MLEQRVRGATSQAVVDARLVADSLGRGSEDLPTLLVGPTGEPGTSVLLRTRGGWTTAGRQVDVDDVPVAVLAGAPARRRLVVDGAPMLAVALPVIPTGDLFVRLVPLTELDQTLRFVSAVLVAGTVLAGLLGVLLGSTQARSSAGVATTCPTPPGARSTS